MRLFGFPPMLGFLLAGFILHVMGMETNDTLEKISDLGILLLLFTIGLKLNIRSLIRKHVWQGGVGHLLLTVVIYTVIMGFLGFFGMKYFSGQALTTILLIAFALSFSSTVFAVKVLEEKGEMRSLQGKTAIAILVIQDILAVVFLTVSKGEYPSVWALLLLGFPFLRKPLLWLMEKSGHGEMMVLFGFILALVGAEIFSIVGMKPDLGALVVGLIVANNTKADELSKVLLNFKEFFLVAFFLSIGLMGTPEWWMLGVSMVFLLFIPIKGFLYFWILSRFGLRSRTSFVIALNLTNYSEFALIVGSVAVNENLLSSEWLLIFAITVSISFLFSSLMNSYLYYSMFEKYIARFERKKRLADDRPILINDAAILIFGMGRLGTKTYDMMESKFGNQVLGLDADYNRVLKHKKKRRNVIIGDVTDSGFWENLEPGNVSLVLLTITNHSANRFAAKRLRQSNFSGKIAAIAKYKDEMKELKSLGVDSVYNIYDEAGKGFAEHMGLIAESSLDKIAS